VSHVDDLIEDFRRRSGLPDPVVKDAAYSYQWHSLTETIRALDMHLEDHQGETITPALRDRIVREMLYGAPSEAEADLRIEMMDGTKLLLEEQVLPKVGIPLQS
jgi:hypothetical protein